jgi:four helix bundle protein
MRSYFDHEKLDVYQLELSFISWVTPLLANVKQRPGNARTAEVIDQLDRASLSALLNTAEGNGRRQRQIRAKFFDDARGSVTECAACLDALVAKKICVGFARCLRSWWNVSIRPLPPPRLFAKRLTRTTPRRSRRKINYDHTT